MDSIKHLFNKFAGREIETKEAYMGACCSCRSCERLVDAPVNPQDPLIEEMKTSANDNGLQLIVYSQSVPVHWGAVPQPFKGHLEVHLEKGGDGKVRVSNNFQVSLRN
ncbi:MAG TPA: hypothetical protein VHK86_04555 [Nitrososphaera sp.]|nr:hypothetical protein [Nitrososphaera sp.]